MTRIKEVHPKKDYQLEVLLDNGSAIVLDLEPKLKTLRFGLLRDTEFFQCAETDGSMIQWDGKVEISIGEVFQIIKK